MRLHCENLVLLLRFGAMMKVCGSLAQVPGAVMFSAQVVANLVGHDERGGE